MKRYLIVTADDYGFSTERNAGIVEAFKNGSVKSASLLLNCTGSEEGAVQGKKEKLCLGLHLNLTEGVPVGTEKYEQLTNSQGEFKGRLGLPKELYEKNIPQEEIETEIRNQIKRYKELVGELPTYVDGHQHIHIHPEVIELFAAALKENGIRVTRYPAEINMEKKPWVTPELLPFFIKTVREAELARPILDKYGVRYADTFAGLSTMSKDMTVEHLQLIILEAFEAAEQNNGSKEYVTCELMSHPGRPTSRDYGGFSWGTDNFGASDDRVHEIEVLRSEEMKEFYKKNNIEIVSHEILLNLD